jgi:hypothetical protein
VEEAVGLARRALELAQQRQERGNQAWTLASSGRWPCTMRLRISPRHKTITNRR